HLRSGKSKHVGVAAGRGAVDKSRIGKEIGRSPQQFDAGAFLFLFKNFHNGVQILVGLNQSLAFGRYVPVMEGVKGGAELFYELERHSRPVLGVRDRVGPIVPGPNRGSNAEWVPTGAAEGVPIHD